ncbi:MAG: SpoIIE family protein phosphatase, partial [Myxococcota bacterium]
HKEGQLQPITPDLAGCSFRLQPGDLLAVCSDGVSDAFGKDTPSILLETLNHCVGPQMPNPDHGDLTRAARALVQHADRQGGRDNITALLIAVGPWLEEMSS